MVAGEVDVSITGVEVMPIWGVISPQTGMFEKRKGTSPGAAPCAASSELACHRGFAFAPVWVSASNA